MRLLDTVDRLGALDGSRRARACQGELLLKGGRQGRGRAGRRRRSCVTPSPRQGKGSQGGCVAGGDGGGVQSGLPVVLQLTGKGLLSLVGGHLCTVTWQERRGGGLVVHTVLAHTMTGLWDRAWMSRTEGEYAQLSDKL